MKSINTYLNERLGDHFSQSHIIPSSYKFTNGSDNMWNYYQSRKKILSKYDLPMMISYLDNDDPIDEEDFVDDLETIFKVNAQNDEYDKFNWLPLAFLLDRDYGIRLVNVITTNGGYGHKGMNSKPYKLVIQYATKDNPRKKMTIEDNSIDWGYEVVNPKGNGFKKDNQYHFYGVKDSKEYGEKILEFIKKVFGNNYKYK